jgi:hypothetical protein
VVHKRGGCAEVSVGNSDASLGNSRKAGGGSVL